jgi:formamidopyrimidine-DNA glycosylase
MSGRIVVKPGPVRAEAERPEEWPDPHDHVRFETDDGTVIHYRDPRRFGLLTILRAEEARTHSLLAGLGPEPLADEFDAAALEAALAGGGAAVKNVLLDQRRIAGLGNIYVCESLFRARISPRRRASTVKGARAARLATAIREVLNEAIEAGGSSLRDHRRISGELGTFQHHFAVYGREGAPCPGCDCGGGVRRIVQGGRSTFFCAKRQR